MKKTIAIDLNDVVRDFSGQFTFLYKKYIDGTCEIKKEDITDFDLSNVFEFEDEDAYRNFRFVDYAFDLHARAMMCDDRLSASLNNWICNELGNLDEPPTILVVSPFEIALTIQSTLSFLAAHGCREREYYFPMDSATIWDRCDVLITANPNLIAMKPEGKTAIKIETAYNKDAESDYTFKSMMDVIEDKDETVLKLMEE